jgi:GT2 family glycosyltransferase
MQLKNNLAYPFVSIVICTYNRKSLLKDCLNSIFAMEYPKSLYEVIIVDGGSTDGTEELIKEFPNIRFITEKEHGLAYARNKGAELARGSIIAYTDDDCMVDKFWLRNLVQGFHFSKKVIGVGGPVYPLHPEIIPRKIYVKAALGLFDDGKMLKPVEVVITSNSAFKKGIFKSVKFDEKLRVTRKGKLILSGEDIDFCQKIVNLGYKLVYVPNAKVYHQIPLERIRVAYIIKHALHGGITKARRLLDEKRSRILAIRSALAQLIQCLLKTALDTSFTSCYKLIYCASALCICLTGLDMVL